MTVVDAATKGIDRAFLTDWAARFLKAWNALDGQAVASLCTDEVVWRDPSSPEPFTGRDGVRGFVDMTGRAFPDFHVAVEEGVGICAAVVTPPAFGVQAGDARRVRATGAAKLMAGSADRVRAG